ARPGHGGVGHDGTRGVAAADDRVAALETRERREGIELRRGPLEPRTRVTHTHGGREAQPAGRSLELSPGAGEPGDRPRPLEARPERGELATVPGEAPGDGAVGAAPELVDPQREIANAPRRIPEPAVEGDEPLACRAHPAGQRAPAPGVGPRP